MVNVYIAYAPKAHVEPVYIWDSLEYCDTDIYFFSGINFFDSEQAELLAENILEDSGNNLDDSLNKYIAIIKNQSLHEIFRPHKVSHQEIAALTKALNPYLRARDIAVGVFYNFKLFSSDKNAHIESFVIKKPDPNRLPITYTVRRNNLDPENINFTLTITSPKIIQKLELVTITIKDTLFGSFTSLPFGNELMQGVLNVLTWRLRMPEQVAKNDNIQILVQHNYADNKFLGYGRIHALIYTQVNQVINAFYFVSQDKKIAGYYDERGRSLEKEFLASPVHTTVATSNQQQRFHPVLKRACAITVPIIEGQLARRFLASLTVK